MEKQIFISEQKLSDQYSTGPRQVESQSILRQMDCVSPKPGKTLLRADVRVLSAYDMLVLDKNMATSPGLDANKDVK